MPKQDDETEGDEGFETGSELSEMLPNQPPPEHSFPTYSEPRSRFRLLLALLLIVVVVVLVLYLIAR